MPIYRGYLIELIRDRTGWHVTIQPTRPDLPILRQHSFAPDEFREGPALDQAKGRVDRLLGK